MTWLLLLTLCGLGGAVNTYNNTVSVIDTATNVALTTIPVGRFPTAVAVSPDGARVYVTRIGSNPAVLVIDTTTNAVIATVTGSIPSPNAIAVTPAALVPTSKDDCKNGGYRSFGPPAGPFRNQGECVSYVQGHSGGRQ